MNMFTGQPPQPSAVFASGYTPGPMHGMATDPDQVVAPAKTYAGARKALLLGVLAFVPVAGVVAAVAAIVTGVAAARFIAAFDEPTAPVKGTGLARTGIALGVLNVLVTVFWLLRLYG